MAELTVASYNVHSCIGADGHFSVERVAGVIRSDVVCLQEVEVNSDVARGAGAQQPPITTRICRASTRWEEAHDVASDADVSGNFCDDGWNRNPKSGFAEDGAARMGRFGTAILSRYPIVKLRVHRYKRYKQKTLRNVMACLVRLPNNRQVWIVNTHLGCHFVGREQQQQAKELVDFVDSLERNAKISGLILSGDFNSLPQFGSMKTIRRSGFVDVWKQMNGRRIGGTFPSDARVVGLPSGSSGCVRLLRLDYIFLHWSSGDIVCKAVYVQDDGCDCRVASDHLPLCGVFYVG
ncbi:hypothetical protein ACHAXT_012843 [Thalassiosira profunda]